MPVRLRMGRAKAYNILSKLIYEYHDMVRGGDSFQQVYSSGTNMAEAGGLVMTQSDNNRE